jgi:predicted lipoprotein
MKDVKLSMVLMILLFFVSCGKENDPTPEFDKEEMLTHMADNVIVPAYQHFYGEVAALESALGTFHTAPTAENLQLLRDQWKNTAQSWQHVKLFDFGPAMDNALKASVGIFPCDTLLIQSNIAAGSYDLNAASNTSAVGLFALDYLFFQGNALNASQNNANYRAYCLALTQKIKTEVNNVINAWASFRSTFVASTGNESTSIFSMLVNDYCQDYEEAKTAKLGIPIGKYSLDILQPQYIEARYSGFSLDLLYESMLALRDIYRGIGPNGVNGPSFDDYLIALDKSTLDQLIVNNYNSILTDISSFSGTLETEMQTNLPALNALFVKISNQVIALKTDMTAAFGVLITYQDNDGD